MDQVLVDKKVLVVGAGESGLAAARLLVALKAMVTITDQKSASELVEITPKFPQALEWRFGDQALRFYENQDLIVISPGVPVDRPELVAARAKGVEVIGEMELGFRYQKLPIIAVTGSNGKTSVTSLTGQILSQAFKEPQFVGGNIGNPLSNLALEFVQGHEVKAKWAVLEVSSFQLETIKFFKAQAAAFLNISPDHLDRHGDMAEYFRTKSRIFERQTREDMSVISGNDELLTLKATQGRRFVFAHGSRPQFGGYVSRVGADDILRVAHGDKDLAEAKWSDYQLTGAHNQENVLAAVGLAMAAGVEPQAALDLAKEFVAGDHRLKFVAEIDGVRFFDDSKGTNVGAVARALDSFEDSVILIAGGRDKGLDYSYLWSRVKRKVSALILLGESREKIRQALGKVAKSYYVNSMDEAVKKAASLAKPGEVVLLSPACASFDMYKNYKERGEKFVQAVESLT
ncbi:MAG: UDP-N-acetylmuramoyl-L-alanine--D-glutamate ligase [Deltaproteobacteria bacterium]|jgi:UDP-N-acetylmuramoylalanine--D-glutamate ligase|nr:UDP-N-acetylmuramoyl-L-alanine--D-glutamate ligase [Deltaproteobacteria bacterium]